MSRGHLKKTEPTCGRGLDLLLLLKMELIPKPARMKGDGHAQEAEAPITGALLQV
jgi:hypothetical protein